MAFRFKKQRRGKAGFTLTELLVTLAILAMVGSVVVAGIPAAHRAYIAAVDTSNAQLLLSTTTTRLRDVLATANPQTIKTGDEADAVVPNAKAVFTSYETGYTTAIVDSSSVEGKEVICLVETNSKGETVTTPLIPEKTSAGKGSQLGTTIGSISYANGVFSVRDLYVTKDGERLETEQPTQFDVRVFGS